MSTHSTSKTKSASLNGDVNVNMADASIPQRPTSPIDKASLERALDKQQQKMKNDLQEALDSRLPPFPTASVASSSTNQPANFWGQLSRMVPFELRKSHDERVTIETLCTQINEMRLATEKIQNDLNKAESSHVSLQKQYDSLSADYSFLKTDLDTVRRDLSEERQKNASLESKAASLRSMLIPPSEANFCDGELQHKFASLRILIHKLVKTTWGNHSLVQIPQPGGQIARALAPFLQKDVNLRYLDSRLCGLIFSMLHEHIFIVRHFGLRSKLRGVDCILGNIETSMIRKQPIVSHGSIMDWRLATMKMTAGLRTDANTRTRAAQKDISQLFGVFRPRSDAAASEGAQMVEKICKDAMDLSLMMRAVKDEYFVMNLIENLGKPVSEYLHLVDDHGEFPITSSSCVPETIAYIITGALVKYPYNNPEDMKVLEKAEAATYFLLDEKMG